MESRPSVLVTRAIFPEVLARLAQVFVVTSNQADTLLTPCELVTQLQGKQGVLCTPAERIDASLLEQCPQLKAVCNIAVGYNNIDVSACMARGMLVSNTPDVLTESTADFGLALMFAAARRITEAEQFLRSGNWSVSHYAMLLGAEIHGSKLGILGMGRIGTAIAKRAWHGFGMQVLYHNRQRLSESQEKIVAARYVQLEELLSQSDHLMIVVPYNKGTHHLIGARQLAQMKGGATLTNIGRGGVVDEIALAAALRDGRLAAAGLDVFEDEPRVTPDLLALSNLVLTPHIASATRATRLAMANLAADNLIAALTGGEAPTPLKNPHHGARTEGPTTLSTASVTHAYPQSE